MAGKAVICAYMCYSFHEQGILDIPAAIKFILKKTGQENLYIIGHSQGATLGMVALSVMPELAKSVKLLMLFGPTYTMVNTDVLVRSFLALPAGVKKLIWGNKAFCPHPKPMRMFNAQLCSFPMIDKLCVHLFSVNLGYNKKNVNTSRIDAYVSIGPDCTSVKTTVHWGQVINSDELKYFDYGSEENIARYNMTTPPFYKLEDIRAPTAVWSGGNDFMADLTDVERLLSQFTYLVSHKHIPSWQHADFVFGLDAPKQLYPSLFWLMEQYK